MDTVSFRFSRQKKHCTEYIKALAIGIPSLPHKYQLPPAIDTPWSASHPSLLSPCSLSSHLWPGGLSHTDSARLVCFPVLIHMSPRCLTAVLSLCSAGRNIRLQHYGGCVLRSRRVPVRDCSCRRRGACDHPGLQRRAGNVSALALPSSMGLIGHSRCSATCATVALFAPTP